MSNVIKIWNYCSVDDAMIVQAPEALPVKEVVEEETMTAEEMEELHEAQSLKDRILLDAETYAEEQLRHTMQEIGQLKEQAEDDIQMWWEERRKLDDDVLEESRSKAFDQGYEEGLEQARKEVQLEYKEMLSEAGQILEQSYALKSQIIQEAEPFLIELSCAIAEKIVGRQLTVSPGWTVQYISQLLSRRKENGAITLCVSPKHFQYIQDAREELALALDSQAELLIIPDASVNDHGCVIRSSFGSIDARVDTQLKEIKTVLQSMAVRGEEVTEDE